MQKCVKYCKNILKKKIEFFNKTQIKYEFLTINNIKIHVLLKNYNFFRESFFL